MRARATWAWSTRTVTALVASAALTGSGCLLLVNEDPDGAGGGDVGTTSSSSQGGGAGGTASGGAGAQGGSGAGSSQAGAGGQELDCDVTLKKEGLAVSVANITKLVVGPETTLEAFAMSSSNSIRGWETGGLTELQSDVMGGLLSARLTAGGTSGAVVVYKSTTDGPDKVATVTSSGSTLVLTPAYDAPDSVKIEQAATAAGHVYGIHGSARELVRFSSLNTTTPVAGSLPSGVLHLVAFDDAGGPGLVWSRGGETPGVSRCRLASDGDCMAGQNVDASTVGSEGLLYDPVSERAILILGGETPSLHVVSFADGASGPVTTSELEGALHFTLAGGRLVAASGDGLVACCLDQLTESEACGPPTGDISIDLIAGTSGAASVLVFDSPASTLERYVVTD